MGAVLHISIATDDDSQGLADELPENLEDTEGFVYIQKLLAKYAGGVCPAKMQVLVEDVSTTTGSISAPAVATITCNNTDLGTGDAIQIGPASLVEGTDFDEGGTNTLTAVALAAAINASSVLKHLVVATASGAEVTLTGQMPGTVGQLRLASTDVSALGFSGDSETVVEATGLMTLTPTTSARIAGARIYRKGVA